MPERHLEANFWSYPYHLHERATLNLAFFNKYCIFNDWMSRLMLKINRGYIWLPRYSLITVMRDIIINELFVIYVNTRLYSVQCCVIIVMDLNFRLKEDKKSWIESRLKRKE